MLDKVGQGVKVPRRKFDRRAFGIQQAGTFAGKCLRVG